MVNLNHSRPFYKVEFFEPEASSAKLIISPNVFLDTEKPSDSSQVSAEIYISHITTTTRLDGAENTCEFEVRHGVGGIIPIDIDYKVKVYFGFYDQDKSVGPDYSLAYTGHVTEIKNGLEKSIISCKSSLKEIAGKKTKITFSKMMGFDEIIKKFAIELGGLQEAQNGIFNTGLNMQPGYGISEQKPILEHLKKLASYSGVNVFLDVFDKFHAIPWDASKLKEKTSDDTPWLGARDKSESDNSDFYKHNIVYDMSLVDIGFETIADKYSGVEVVSFMPLSDDFVHTIEPVKVEFKPPGSDGSKLPLRRYKISHITREDAEKIAENLYWRENRLISGNIKLFGAPQIRVGDGLKFEGELLGQTPFEHIKFNDGGSDKKIEEIMFQVAQVQQKFDTSEGYTTNLKFVYAHGVAGGGAAAAAGAGAEAGAGAGITSTETEFAGVAGAEELEAVTEAITEPEGPKQWLRLNLRNSFDEPLADTPYKLTIDGVLFEGTTNSDGLLEEEIPADAKSGKLIYGDQETKLKLGPIEPIDTVEGWQTRLNNLGYDVGVIDGTLNDQTESAIEEFQSDYGLKVDGIVGPKTKAKLMEVHGN